MKQYTRIYITDDDNSGRILSGKTIRDFSIFNDDDTQDNYIAVTFTDDTYVLIGIKEDPDDLSHIFQNCTSYDEDMFYRFTKCGYRNANGDFVYPKSVQRLIDLGIFQRDKEKEDMLCRHYHFDIRMSNYRNYVRMMYEVDKDIMLNCPIYSLSDDTGSYTKDELRTILLNMVFRKSDAGFMMIRKNPFYDMDTFSLDMEIGRKDLVIAYNPYRLYDEFMDRIRDTLGIMMSDMVCDPGNINLTPTDKGIPPAGMPSEWYDNHVKQFGMCVTMVDVHPGDMVLLEDGGYGLSASWIDTFIRDNENESIYYICGSTGKAVGRD